MTFTVIVCGGRDYKNVKAVYAALDRVRAKHGDLIVKHGGASGADLIASRWAKGFGQQEVVFTARWQNLGARAGPKRNEEMVASGADWLIAFPGGLGTADCVRRARTAKIPVWFPEGAP